VLVAALGWRASHQEAGHYLRLLAAETDPDVCTRAERAALPSLWRRRAARRYAVQRRGHQAGREVRHLQRVQARLAVELSRGGQHPDWYRQLARASRLELRRLGHPEAFAPPGAVPPWWLIALLVTAVAGLCVLFVALASGAGVR
jgi:hypothetical protein